jgi:glyoxylase-like metal-dependent hydrolase (beta-lactamase superfamily II)
MYSLIPHIRQLALATLTATLAWSAQALEVKFEAVAPNVYAYVGDTDGRTYENEALNANIGLVVTPAGALLIDPGATWQSARKIAEAAKKVTPQPIKWVINTGGQDHRWMGNGYFKAQGAEIMAHASAEADMKARGPEHLRANAPVLKDKLSGTEIALPTRWLQGADTALDLGDLRVQVLHRGGGPWSPIPTGSSSAPPAVASGPDRHFQDLSITRRCTEFEQLMSANDSNHDVTTVC